MLSSMPIVIQESTCAASTSPVGLIGLCAASFSLSPAMLNPTTSAPAFLRKLRREEPAVLTPAIESGVVDGGLKGLNREIGIRRSPLRNAQALGSCVCGRSSGRVG